ncbi:hypothetical protein [Sorangium sp. So ce363]|uniref:hypothetical protein n=1 Tax=Sorangium sp. So ce363 TaxID=3133304 RepID=UPI003F5D8C67
MSERPAPNPFQPPQANLSLEPARAHGSAGKALLFGVLADLGLTMVLGIAFLIAYAVFLASMGATDDGLAKAITSPSAGFTSALTAIGTFGSAIGGYTCARTARHMEYRLAWVLIALSLVLGWVLVGDGTSVTQALVTTVLTIGGTLFGAWAGAQQNRRRG